MDTIFQEYNIFWKQYFPEINEMSQTEAQALCREDEIGAGCTFSGQEYQDLVARVYGAYEPEDLQMRTFKLLYEFVSSAGKAKSMISFGCGPGSMELFLLYKGKIKELTLVDISGEMLTRSRSIAEDLGIADQVEFVQSNVEELDLTKGVGAKRYDLSISINSMHWSKQWKTWIDKVYFAGNQHARCFISFTMHHPSSNFTSMDVAKSAKGRIAVLGSGFVKMPEDAGGGMSAVHMRFYFYGKKVVLNKKSNPAKKKKKKRKK